MARTSGVSHAVAALVAVALAPLLTDLVTVLVRSRDVRATVERFGTLLASYPAVPFSVDGTTLLVHLVAIAVVGFVWGYAYHVTRHG